MTDDILAEVSPLDAAWLDFFDLSPLDAAWLDFFEDLHDASDVAYKENYQPDLGPLLAKHRPLIEAAVRAESQS